MQITDLLKRESVELNGSAASKKDVLEQVIALMVKQGNIADLPNTPARCSPGKKKEAPA